MMYIKIKRKIYSAVVSVVALMPHGVWAQYMQGTAQKITYNPLMQYGVQIVNFILGSCVVYILLIMLLAGIIFFTSGGDEDRMDTAIRWWKKSLIGLVVVPLLYIAINTLGESIGVG